MSPPAASALRPSGSLQHLVWRGDQLASASPGISTGHSALDSVLPGRGWPIGALTEILVPHTGVGELGLILPLFQQVPEKRWAVCIAPPGQLYAPALSGAGVSLERLLFVDAESPAHARWAARQSLNSHSCEAVVMWLADADNSALRRLQLAAEESATVLVMIRPMALASQPSPAVLRLALSARDGGVDVRVLKRRGPQLAGPVAVDLPRLPVRPAPASQLSQPLNQPSSHATVHALVRPLPARTTPAGLRAGAG